MNLWLLTARARGSALKSRLVMPDYIPFCRAIIPAKH